MNDDSFESFFETMTDGILVVVTVVGLVGAVVLFPIWAPLVALLWCVGKLANRWG